MQNNHITPIQYKAGKILLLDQTLLPAEETYIEIKTKEAMWEAISSLRVRGAPAIGIAAAYGAWLAIKDFQGRDYRQLRAAFRKGTAYLATSRPTAVNLSWALQRMEKKLDSLCPDNKGAGMTGVTKDNAIEAATPKELQKTHGQTQLTYSKETHTQNPVPGNGRQPWQTRLTHIKETLLREAENIRAEDEAACYAMGQHGLTLLEPDMGILTHCNAGSLATAKYGTCLAPIYLGQTQGYNFKVFADETRPLLQGARLTAWELQKAGIDTTLICDNMAATVMSKGWIDAVVVGCDRMAINGDGANKIGTAGLAILAKAHNIPFYMFAPTSTIDAKAATGKDIPIEERAGTEISHMWYENPMAPQGIKTFNPAFDVTPHSYITAVITERGIARPPYEKTLPQLLKTLAGTRTNTYG